VHIDEVLDDIGLKNTAAVVVDVVGFKQLHNIDVKAVAVGGCCLVDLVFELVDSRDLALFLIRELKPAALVKPEVDQTLGVVQVRKCWCQLPVPDVG